MRWLNWIRSGQGTGPPQTVEGVRPTADAELFGAGCLGCVQGPIRFCIHRRRGRKLAPSSQFFPQALTRKLEAVHISRLSGAHPSRPLIGLDRASNILSYRDRVSDKGPVDQPIGTSFTDHPVKDFPAIKCLAAAPDVNPLRPVEGWSESAEWYRPSCPRFATPAAGC